MVPNTCTRRKFVGTLGAAAGAWLARPALGWATSTPAGRVAIGKCHEYGSQVASSLATLFDQVGGLSGLVRGKTVAIKLNLTGGPGTRVAGLPAEMTYWVHPDVVAATVHLLSKAGAQRIRILESPMSTAESLEHFMARAKWNPQDFTSAAPRVEFENTNYLGQGKKYSRLAVPGGGLMFNAYDLNHSFEDCDVFVSLAKLKEHSTAGVTLSMKNCFGNTPCTIYGDGAGKDEPSPVPHGGRGMLHDGHRLPSKSAPTPLAAYNSKDPGFRVPRVTADLVAARPIHLAIIDGIHTMTAGEGPWTGGNKPVQPGVLVAGTNCVAADAVGMALMGFDPMADRGTAPFEKCDSTLKLAEQLGLGTRDLKRIEVIGTPIAEARMSFRAV